MLLKNDIITQKILIDNFIYAVTYQDGNFILHHDQLLSPASVDIVSISTKSSNSGISSVKRIYL